MHKQRRFVGKIQLLTHVISELHRFLKKKKNNFEFNRFAYGLFIGVLGYFEHESSTSV